MIRDQDRGDRQWIDLLERPDDSLSGIRFILTIDFVIRHDFGQRNRPMEIVRVRGTETRNGFTGLGPGGSVLRMRVGNPAYLRKGAVQGNVRGKVRRWTQCSFNDLALKIGHDQMLWLHPFIRHTARLDYDQALFAGNTASVPKSREH